MERKPAVAVVFHHIGPYHHARLNAAADRLSVTGIEWSAKGYDAWGAAATPSRYHKVSLFPEATDHYPDKPELRSALWSALEQATPDVVAVNGWNNFGSLIAANCCLRRAIRMVVMSESSHQDEARTWWKEAIKRRIVGLYSAALVGGRRHVEYLVELGMPRETIFIGYDVVDKDYFGRLTAEIRNSRLRTGYGGQATSEIRNELGLPENYFLASARFIEKKNLSRLISAYSKYRQNARNSGAAPWDLVLLGDGPLREALNSQLSTLNLNENVHLPGFKPYDELPAYYALAKAFVHASTTEQWGLVINEATASSLPVIVSDRCGCAPELVNGNGFTFDPTNEAELTARLLKMASLSDEERKQLGENSYRIAANFAPERFGEGLERAARMAMGVPQKKFGPIDRALFTRHSKTLAMKGNDPVAAYFDKLPETHKRQFEERVSGANFNFQQRLTLACELGAASSGRLLDCASGTGETTCALLKSGRFTHATIVDISPKMLQTAKRLLTSEIKNAEVGFVESDVFNFKPSDAGFDLILCLGLIAHTGRLDILLPHLKSMLAAGGRIILQTTLVDYFGTRIVRALSSRRELVQRGYRVSWFSERDITDACSNAGLQILQKRQHGLGIPFGDRIWPSLNFQLEKRLQEWSSRHGADAIYLLAGK